MHRNFFYREIPEAERNAKKTVRKMAPERRTEPAETGKAATGPACYSGKV